MGIPERYSTERDKKAPKKMEGTLLQRCIRRDAFID